MHVRNLVPLLFVAVAGTAFAQAKADDAAADLKKLEGTWVLVSGKKDGQALPGETVSKSRIVWKGKDVVVETPHQSKDPIKATATVSGGATKSRTGRAPTARMPARRCSPSTSSAGRTSTSCVFAPAAATVRRNSTPRRAAVLARCACEPRRAARESGDPHAARGRATVMPFAGCAHAAGARRSTCRPAWCSPRTASNLRRRQSRSPASRC